MIDYYMHKKCRLRDPEVKERRCKACVWFDGELSLCIFASIFPRFVPMVEFINRAGAVDGNEQKRLSEPWQRFRLEG
jgi:hypothetical protein